MSRKIGTGAVSLGAVDFFSARAGGLFVAAPIEPCWAVWADSRPVKAINEIVICPARMQCDCSAIPLLQFWIVMLSDGKDLLFLPRCKRQEMLTLAQDDT